jgi:hypothetical protein
VADFDPLHPVFHDPNIEDFTVEDHLDRDTIKALAGYSTIGSPLHLVTDLIDDNQE